MKLISKYIAGTAVVMTMATLQSCSLDEPFGDGGDGRLSISTEINGDVTKHTRAGEDADDSMTLLRQQCTVFIENSKGVIRKYKGVDNIPASITLASGDYCCNAWSGDSVSASYTQKFYRGKQNFNIIENQNTSLLVKCNIANVVVSVAQASLDAGLSDMKVTFSTTKGELAFDAARIQNGDKGYFMTPHPDMKGHGMTADEYAENTKLNVLVEGKAEDGSAFSKKFEIKDVQRAHEYAVTVTSKPGEITQGGAVISLVVKDIPIIEDTIDVFAAPHTAGVGFDIAEAVNEIAADKTLNIGIRAYFGLNAVKMTLGHGFNNTGLEGEQNLLDATVRDALKAKGIEVTMPAESTDAETGVPVQEMYIVISKDYIATLPKRTDLYDITFQATDAHDQTSVKKLQMYNTLEAMPTTDPAVAGDVPTPEMTPMAFGATHLTLTGFLNDATATDYGFEYRAAGTEQWSKASALTGNNARRRAKAQTKNIPYSVTIKGLQPGTTYEYRAYADDFVSNKVFMVSTESKFLFPNASFEEWSTYQAKTLLGTKTVIFPGTGSEPTFWDSGNEGAATGNATLTDKTTDMIHSGTYALRMETKLIVGKIAAGNLFAGDYVKTDGTNGVLALGREYNGSHPSKLRVYANYRPGQSVKIAKGNEEFVPLVSGGTDHGQIYVALTVGPVDIRTNPNDRKLFNPDDEQVLAYGEVTLTEGYGPDGALKQLEIPLSYNERAQTTRPTHIVVVCCASKYGDFFSGSAGSVMYLDDMELIYE